MYLSCEKDLAMACKNKLQPIHCFAINLATITFANCQDGNNYHIIFDFRCIKLKHHERKWLWSAKA